MARVLAIDFGERRIGLALSDPSATIAQPLPTLMRRAGKRPPVAAIVEIIQQNEVERAVVGLPLNLAGSDSPRTQSVRAFARNLEPLGLPILLWDERWSTQAVERAMIDADVSRGKRAGKVDALAAAHILQGAIDALANLPGPQ